MRIAYVGQGVKETGLIWVPAKREGSADEVRIWPGLAAFLKQWTQVRQKLLARETRKPRVVKHDQVVSAGARFEIYQFFLKKICVRKLDDVDVRLRL